MTLITPQLALGDREDPIKYARHFDSVLCCAEEIPLFPKKPGHHLPLQDGAVANESALDAAFRFLDEQVQAKRLVLVYCGHGLSRSVSVLAGFIALKSSEAPETVLDRIRKLRPGVCPSAATFKSVAQYVERRRNGPDNAGN